MNYYEDEYGNIYTEDEWKNKNFAEIAISILFFGFILIFKLIKWGVKKIERGQQKMKEKNIDCLVDYSLGFLPLLVCFSPILSVFIPFIGIAYEIILIPTLIWRLFIKDKVSEHIWVKPMRFYIAENNVLMCEAQQAKDGKNITFIANNKLERKLRKRRRDFWVRINIYRAEMYGEFWKITEEKAMKLKIDKFTYSEKKYNVMLSFERIARIISSVCAIFFLCLFFSNLNTMIKPWAQTGQVFIYSAIVSIPILIIAILSAILWYFLPISLFEINFLLFWSTNSVKPFEIISDIIMWIQVGFFAGVLLFVFYSILSKICNHSYFNKVLKYELIHQDVHDNPY